MNYTNRNDKRNENNQNNTSSFSQSIKKNKTNISDVKPGMYFSNTVKIVRKIVPGPTIFVVTDGYGYIDAVTKQSSYDAGDIVEINGKVGDRNGQLRIELDTIKKSEMNFDEIIDEKSKVPNRTLSISTPNMLSLEPKIREIAQKIRKAILLNQPIFIRHHADADGITSGLAIDHATRALMKKIGINPSFNLYRSPSKAPYYETTDLFKDLVLTKRLTNEKNQEKPLFLILDNGSTPEDTFALKSLHTLGYDVIVIDHHNPVEFEGDKSSVCPYLIGHLNPYLHGFDSNISAGMLCYEVARFINGEYDEPILPAVSALGDRCEGDEVEPYIKNAGIPLAELDKIPSDMDYLAYHFKFDSGKGVYEELLGDNEFKDIIYDKMTSEIEKQLGRTRPHRISETLGNTILNTIDIENYSSKFNYPPAGKTTGMLHDEVVKANEDKNVITIGFFSDMMIFRETVALVPVPKFMEEMHTKFPQGNVEGGGHDCAGTIKFNKEYFEKILKEVKLKINESQ